MKTFRVIVALAAALTGWAAVAAETDKTGMAVGPSGTVEPGVGGEEASRGAYPRKRVIDGHALLIYAPQIRKWPEFKRCEAWAAIELHPGDGSAALYGTVTVSGNTDIDLEQRLVVVTAPKVDEILFKEKSAEGYKEVVRHGVTRDRLEVPVDVFLSHLADDVLKVPTPKGFNDRPPQIRVVQKPSLLLFVNGAPVFADLGGSGLKVVVNANWPVVQDPDSERFFLLNREQWLTAHALRGPWTATRDVPPGLATLDPEGEHAALRAAIPAPETKQPVPEVIHATVPTELIVTEGLPALKQIAGTGGLSYVANTQSPLFKLKERWYFLAAGRWFTASNLPKGPWSLVVDLPKAFQTIPKDHPTADIRASVPGTAEARLAALEALLPVRKPMSKGSTAPVEVTYAEKPVFEPIETTGVSRAVNTGYDVLLYQGVYFLCYAGAWYTSNSPTGPWTLATSVPEAIYSIPANSPSYPVTYVQVEEVTPTTVVYDYTPAYGSSVYVVEGVPVYGTGWYYPPYVQGTYYYPYYNTSYGHGHWYNPRTGTYGSRSVWYGPYGGYSYAEGYNPRTGRYGYVESAWDNDDWKSQGETYNPRTGIKTETKRHYSEGDDRMTTERTVSRGDKSISSERTVDYDDKTVETKRETSRGGSSQRTREVTDGQMTGEGTVQTRSGKSAQVSGQYGGGKGRTTIQGSEGGKAVSVSKGGGRTTVGQSGSGDLYAGHDGEVYKKTADGWYHYGNGGWQQVDQTHKARTRASSATQQQTRAASSAQQGSAGSGQELPPRPVQLPAADQSHQAQAAATARSTGVAPVTPVAPREPADLQQLNRDARARQEGYQRFEQRSAGPPAARPSGGSRAPGGFGGRGGGGRRR